MNMFMKPNKTTKKQNILYIRAWLVMVMESVAMYCYVVKKDPFRFYTHPSCKTFMKNVYTLIRKSDFMKKRKGSFLTT